MTFANPTTAAEPPESQSQSFESPQDDAPSVPISPDHSSAQAQQRSETAQTATDIASGY